MTKKEWIVTRKVEPSSEASNLRLKPKSIIQKLLFGHQCSCRCGQDAVNVLS